MKKARPFIPYFFIAVFAVVFIRSEKHKHPVSMPEGSTIFDTSVMMLNEFVREGQDTNLGFSHIDEVDLAWIDTTVGIDLYYLREDSLDHSTRPIDASLRSSITFQLTDRGWQPVAFDDSNIIAAAIRNHRPRQPASKDTSIILVEAPSTETELVLEHSKTGTHLIPTPELRRVVGDVLPLDVSNPSAPIDEGAFVFALRKYSENELHHLGPLNKP
jgi:hypothetical protein